MLICAVLCCAVLICAVLRCAVLCCAVLCCAVLCCAVLCCAVLCCAVLCCAALCHQQQWQHSLHGSSSGPEAKIPPPSACARMFDGCIISHPRSSDHAAHLQLRCLGGCSGKRCRHILSHLNLTKPAWALWTCHPKRKPAGVCLKPSSGGG